MTQANSEKEIRVGDFQPLFGKRARAPPPKRGTKTGLKRAVEIEPRVFDNAV